MHAIVGKKTSREKKEIFIMSENHNNAVNVLADNKNDLAHGLLAKDGKPLD